MPSVECWEEKEGRGETLEARKSEEKALKYQSGD